MRDYDICLTTNIYQHLELVVARGAGAEGCGQDARRGQVQRAELGGGAHNASKWGERMAP